MSLTLVYSVFKLQTTYHVCIFHKIAELLNCIFYLIRISLNSPEVSLQKVVLLILSIID